VQSVIPSIESLMAPEIADKYRMMNEKLNGILQLPKENIIPASRQAIDIVRQSIGFLKTYCSRSPFRDQESEILFFKIIKPHFHANLVYWMAVFEIELGRPVGGLKREMKFLEKRLESLYAFFEQHTDFYKYYRSGQTDRDKIYFLRDADPASFNTDPHIADADPLFTTGYDFRVTEILANDRIRDYLRDAINALLDPGFSRTPDYVTSGLQWTASKTGLVELIYALQSGGVYNNGQMEIKEIAETFQRVFKVDLGNYYHAFNELRLRKKNRTSLLDLLREKVIQKMDALDEK
jgi:hypothetical protein